MDMEIRRRCMAQSKRKCKDKATAVANWIIGRVGAGNGKKKNWFNFTRLIHAKRADVLGSTLCFVVTVLATRATWRHWQDSSGLDGPTW